MAGIPRKTVERIRSEVIQDYKVDEIKASIKEFTKQNLVNVIRNYEPHNVFKLSDDGEKFVFNERGYFECLVDQLFDCGHGMSIDEAALNCYIDAKVEKITNEKVLELIKKSKSKREES